MTLFFLISMPLISANLNITNTNYNLIKSKSSISKQYYNIFVTIENTASKSYENITVEIVDEFGIPTQQIHSFEANEIKTFTFEDYPFAGGTNHQIKVNYYPTNTSLTNNANSGTTTFNITYDTSEGTETPSVTTGILLITIISIAIIIKRKYKEK